ncbi:uncharacterized protein A4U43_C08F26390 [Asparagus officinalis]|nr:uncharacterized protein A4U43_C08F26390 [Asparagus officinalis]
MEIDLWLNYMRMLRCLFDELKERAKESIEWRELRSISNTWSSADGFCSRRLSLTLMPLSSVLDVIQLMLVLLQLYGLSGGLFILMPVPDFHIKSRVIAVKDGDRGDDDLDEDGTRDPDPEGRVGKYIGVKVKACRTLIGILPYAGLKFYIYEELKTRVPKDYQKSVTLRLSCGALADLFGQTLTYPFEVSSTFYYFLRISSTVDPSDYTLYKNTDYTKASPKDKSELWKPLNCLVEAANKTKVVKSSSQSSDIKEKKINCEDSEVVLDKEEKWARRDSVMEMSQLAVMGLSKAGDKSGFWDVTAGAFDDFVGGGR